MLAERLDASERMDDPDLAKDTYARVLHDLAQVNRVTLAYRPTLDFLRRAADGHRHLRVLDVGFGDGDMLRQIARWAVRRGVEAELVGVDLNPGSAAAAASRTPAHLPIRYCTGDYLDFVGSGFDCIISSLVAHHMSEAELLLFLNFMESEARRGWFVNDLYRHGFAYWGFPVLARLMRWHPIVRGDGQTSIARAFRPGDWDALLGKAGIDHARVQRIFPFRLCVERLR